MLEGVGRQERDEEDGRGGGEKKCISIRFF